MGVRHKLLMRLLLLGSGGILVHIGFVWAESALPCIYLLATATPTDSTDASFDLVLETLADDPASLLG